MSKPPEPSVHSPPPHLPARPAEAVIDTNVLLDWLVFDEPSVRPLSAALAASALTWVATQAMLDELADVLTRPLPERWDGRRADAMVRAASNCMLLPAMPMAPAGALWCTDPDDQKFIDFALARPARYLFTRDKALLRLARRAASRGVLVLTPAAWARAPGPT